MKLLVFLVRLSLGILVTLLVLVALAIIIVPRAFDPNDYKDQISSLVKEHTQRDLLIEGDLALSVFPRLGVETGKLSLSQPNHLSDKFGNGNMLEVGAVKVHLKMLPLLKSLASETKDIQIGTIILNQPQVEIITLKNGLSSLSGFNEEPGQEAHDELASEEQNVETAAKASIALVVQGVEMESARLVWDDRKAGQSYELREFNVVTGNLLGDELEPISISGELIDSSTPDITQFDLKGSAKVDINSLSATVKDMTVELERGDLFTKLDFSQLQFEQDALITVNDIETNLIMSSEEVGPLNIEASIPNVAFNQASQELAIDSLKAKGHYQERPVDAQLNNVHLGLESQKLSLSSLNVDFAGAVAQLLNVKATNILDNPKASAKLKVPAFDPRPVLESFAVDFVPSNAQALRSVSLDADVSGGMESASLKNLLITVDKTKLEGFVAVKDYSKPKADFNLSINQLNIDDYLPESQAGEGENEASGAQALLVPMAIFEQFKANGKLQVGELIASGVKVSDIAVNVKSNSTGTTITPNANLYNGSFGGKIQYEKLSNGGRLTVDNDLKSVNIGGLFSDASLTDQLSGIANLGINLVVEDIDGKQTNKGLISLGAKDGAIKGVDIQKMLRKANNSYNQLKGRELEDASTESDETRFAAMGGTFKLNNYQIDNADFSMQAPLFRVAGAGNIDILNQLLDYTVKIAVVNSVTGQGGESLEKLKGITVPVRLSGSLTSPSYKIDTKALLKSAFGKKVEDKKAALIKDKLGIEGGAELGTKNILKEALNKKFQEKYGTRNSSAGENPQVQNQAAPEALGNQASPQNPQPEQQPTEQKSKEQIKQELKEELKRKAFESLFG